MYFIYSTPRVGLLHAHTNQNASNSYPKSSSSIVEVVQLYCTPHCTSLLHASGWKENKGIL